MNGINDLKRHSGKPSLKKRKMERRNSAVQVSMRAK
jgi:hypothetical protein